MCLTLQRTTDQLRHDKISLERKLQDAEIDNSNRQIQIDNETSNTEQNNVDDDEGLSDTDSDVIEMKLTLNELKNISTLPTTKKPEINPTFFRSISYEKPSNQSLIDSGRWSNTMLSSITNTYQPSLTKTAYWQSQPSLITREAVLKAARDVLPPGVIDHLTSKH